MRPNRSESDAGLSRRTFVGGAAGTALLAGAVGAQVAAPKAERGPHKAVLYSMLPGNLTVEDRMKLARDVGFEGVEAPPLADPKEQERLRAAAEAAGIRIHSVIYGGWDPPLSSPDPQAAAQSLKNAEAALRCAKALGADDILLVPAVVDARTRYVEAYHRAQQAIRRLVPFAEQLQVKICLEEVWNNFLLSPLEFAAFVDSFHSPWVGAYFDVGNVVPFAWPQDWIRTLGHRIQKVHLKDFKGGPGLFGGIGGHFVNLLEGSIDWPEVRRAFAEIGYTGYMTTELAGGDAAYLRDVSQRVDKILAGS
ncbi:sugar phosphate isomerase/epimerase family protein [Chthonomonas calidirosea]|uniref:sugar phosphate isomerase/epimerase family protein n=1 Tax=Chthonomonas calidirosea TaxID=454171 RepID=UPI0006EC5E6B|nr:sugar phosphate isomerase/epimerase family protein [Chthonomonas calidirosea]CEK17303.1 sugar phosphate isomerase/epimerase [Chthonomonas calidirosea]